MLRMLVLLAGVVSAAGSLRAAAILHRAPDVTAVDTWSPPGAGVPLALARERAARVRDLRYDVRFSVPAAVAEPVKGRLVLRFALTDASTPLALDFAAPRERIARVTSGGRDVPVEVVTEHLVLPQAALKNGANEFTIEFLAGDASLNRTAEFMYTLFVPARARLAFPCFDQPDLKARFTLALDIPAGWQAVANGAEMSRREEGDRLHLLFSETQPLPTYLFAFAAGQFKVETATRNERTFRMFHRETDAEKVARNRDTIFDLHAAALAWLEEYTGIPYAFGKFDFLLVPSFQFGGMEHAGAIFYNASGLLLDPSATQNQKLGRASLIAHETAHMWFGDLVTMRWFNDVWMKEVFANFMAAKIVNPSFPEINHDLRFLFAHYPAAYEVDRTAGSNAIRQPLDNLAEAGSLYGAIIYQKAPIVMRQLELIVGAERLRDGLRQYLGAHRFANASWPDLIDVLDALTPEDLAAWSRVWVEEAGRPAIATRLRVENGQVAQLALEQSDPVEGRGLAWTERLELVLGRDKELQRVPVTLAGRTTDVSTARGLPAPRFVLPTGGGLGYGGFTLDDASRSWLLAHAAEIPDSLTRGSAWVTLWEEMLDGRVAPSAMVEALIAGLPKESDELTVQRMLSYTQQAYWKWIAVEQRKALVPRLELVLRAGLEAAATPSRKSAWFSALRDTAQTPATLAWLERVWRKTEPVPGLVLAEPDYIALAMELAVRAVPAWKEILDAQEEATQNPDRKARFAFVRPALSPDPAVRDAFFASLADVKNRRREPWVLEGLAYLHHPLRAAASEKYIRPSLEMLAEIQRTGDIFFPKRWMDATLSGHGSTTAARTVRSFLAALPSGYPDRLRRIILSSADDLFRSNSGAASRGH